MSKNQEPLPDWEAVISAASHLQEILPGAVLVGGTASALYAHHRFSSDADHVLTDLSTRFDQVLEDLESISGWTTARVRRPVLILGSLDGIETGVRQLIRKAPLETVDLQIGNHIVKVPTQEEILRIKAVLILKRNATRDYVDFVALANHLGNNQAVIALRSLEELYPQEAGESPLQQLQIQLSNPLPFDLEETQLSEYKNLDAQWHEWGSVAQSCSAISTLIFESF